MPRIPSIKLDGLDDFDDLDKELRKSSRLSSLDPGFPESIITWDMPDIADPFKNIDEEVNLKW